MPVRPRDYHPTSGRTAGVQLETVEPVGIAALEPRLRPRQHAACALDRRRIGPPGAQIARAENRVARVGVGLKLEPDPLRLGRGGQSRPRHRQEALVAHEPLPQVIGDLDSQAVAAGGRIAPDHTFGEVRAGLDERGPGPILDLTRFAYEE